MTTTSYDVAILGGGVMGLSLAYELSRTGRSWNYSARFLVRWAPGVGGGRVA